MSVAFCLLSCAARWLPFVVCCQLLFVAWCLLSVGGCILIVFAVCYLLISLLVACCLPVGERRSLSVGCWVLRGVCCSSCVICC